MLLNRLSKIRRKATLDTQRIRAALVSQLSEMFDLASNQVRNPRLDISERQGWMRVAAYTAQVIQSIAKGFDAVRLDEQLQELERMIDEVRSKAGKGEAGVAEAPEEGAEGAPPPGPA